MAASPETTSMALFCDFENVALGVRDARYDKFDIKKVLERLLLKGSIVVKKAYCDWDRYREFKAPMHEANFELIEIPHVRQSGKNSADIRMVVDALDLCYTKAHVDTFVIISGDSDFSPLVSKLRENAKTVIGVGVKGSTSDLLTANCDEFIFYDDLVRAHETRRRSSSRANEEVGERATRSDKAEKAAASGAPRSTQPQRSARTVRTEKVAPIMQLDPAAAAPATADATTVADKPATRRGGRRTSRKAVDEQALPSVADTAVETPSEPPSETVPETAAPLDATPAELFHDDEAPIDTGHERRSEAERRQEAIDLVVETVEALITERGADDKIWGSMVKQTLKRRRPGFAESYYGYRTFNDLLEDAGRRHLLALDRDEKSGGYVIRLL